MHAAIASLLFATITAPAPAAKPLPPVVINNVLFAGVEFDAPTVTWRNLAVTVTAARVTEWRSLSPAAKAQSAQSMIELYRRGMSYQGDIKLTFIDEAGATLDQYVWVPPAVAPPSAAPSAQKR